MQGRRYVLSKIGQALATLAFVVAFNFFLFRVMPGDPVRLLARAQGLELSRGAIRELIADLGLNKPLFAQFWDYLGDTLRGNFGDSFIFGEPVTTIFGRFMWPTILLVGVATVLMTVIGLFLGVRGGWNRGSKSDLASMGISLVLYSMPEFWLGMMLLVLFATTLGWFPQGGYKSTQAGITGLDKVVDILNHMFLPTITLTLAYIGEYYLLMRSSLLDVLGEDYITAARAKGIRESQVLWRHAVRNALLPTVTLLALSFGFVIGGAITVELVFSYPGLGLLTFEALEAQDYALLQGMFLFFSAAVIVANLIADILYSYLDPRVREA
ncbi:MAG TPA: ABC transporter permease [Actinomycetota bacterium]|nr:ABC transporter permease [Actinomycetota bacterium]